MSKVFSAIYARGPIFAGPTAFGSPGQAIVDDGAGNLSFATVATTNPAGSGTELQYRNGSAFGAIANSSYSAGVVTLPALAVTDLTATRIPYVGTAGRLVDSQYLQFSGSSLTLGENASFAQLSMQGTGQGEEIRLDSRVSNVGIRFGRGGVPGTFDTNIVSPSAGMIAFANGNNGTSFRDIKFRSMFAVPQAITDVPINVNLASGQSADAIQVTSSGGTAGDLFKVSAVGATTINNRATVTGVAGSKVFTLTTPATNDDPTLDIYQNRVATTDATVTTLHTIAIADNTTYTITATAHCRCTGGAGGRSGESGIYRVTGRVRRFGGIALLGISILELDNDDGAAWTIGIDVDGGNNARVRVTGGVTDDLVWHLSKLEVSPLST